MFANLDDLVKAAQEQREGCPDSFVLQAIVRLALEVQRLKLKAEIKEQEHEKIGLDSNPFVSDPGCMCGK